MKLSSKVDKLPYSPIRKLVPFAEQAEKLGKKIYYLNIGQPDLPTPEPAIQFLKDNIPEVIAYSHSAGMEELRKHFQRYYQREVGVDLPLSAFLVTTGASEALIFTFSVLLNSGDEVIIPEPMYANYIGFSAVVDAVVKPITSRIENGFALPSVDEFEKLITARTKAIMICNPNNPTGYLYSEEELRQLAEIVKKHDLWLIVDEVYREFTFDGRKHISVLTFDDIRDRTIVIDSVSKRYSACGARIGLVVSANEQFMDAVLRMAQARLSPPTLGQILSLGLLQLPDDVIKSMVKQYEQRRNVTIAELQKMEGVIAPTPSGAFYTVVELPVDDAEEFSKWLLTDFDYEGETVMFAPAGGFYINREYGKRQVRIAFVLETDKMQRAMHILSVALEKYRVVQP